MSEHTLADVFAARDIVVMERAAPDSFLVHGIAPAWLRRVNARWKGERQILASRTFPFLDHFLVDAEAFWSSDTPGRIGSGLSTEPGADGQDFHFEAWAVTTESGAHYLLLEYRRDGAELQQMLQRAREGVLERERLERTQQALERSRTHLKRARDAAEMVAGARAAMIATIAHEVRTPVHAIIGLSGLMLDSAPDPGQARFLGIIRSTSETLLTVLDDMIDAARLEATGMTVEARAFDLRQTVDEALDVVAVRAAERDVDLICQVDLSVPESVVGDATRIRQVLVNLLSNAVKFTPGGDVLVVAEAQQRADGKSELHFAVRDEGPGIPAGELDTLISASGVADVEEGWTPRRSMGLAICRTLVARMGGRLWAESRENKGSTFHFTVSVDVARGEQLPYLSAHQPILEGRHVWILGASPATEQQLINQARFWGMVPRGTGSAEESARWVETAAPPDVVLLDRTAARADDFVLPRSPVIELITLGRAQEAAARPAAAVLTKPLKFARLHATLVALLGAAPETPRA